MAILRQIDIREERPAQRVGWSTSWAAREAEDYTGANIEFGLLLTLGNTQIFAATHALDTPASDGSARSWMPYLLTDFELEEGYEPGTGGAGVRTITVSLPGAVVDALGQVQSGLLLAGVGELSLVFDDQEIAVPGDPYMTHTRAGERNVFRFIIKKMIAAKGA